MKVQEKQHDAKPGFNVTTAASAGGIGGEATVSGGEAKARSAARAMLTPGEKTSFVSTYQMMATTAMASVQTANTLIMALTETSTEAEMLAAKAAYDAIKVPTLASAVQALVQKLAAP